MSGYDIGRGAIIEVGARLSPRSEQTWVSQTLQPLLLVQLQQCLDQRIEMPLHDLVEIEILLPAAFAAQAVIGAAVLRKIIRADALAAVAAAHHQLSRARLLRVLL